MSEVRSPLSAEEIKRQAEFRREAVRPPESKKSVVAEPNEVKTFEVSGDDLVQEKSDNKDE